MKLSEPRIPPAEFADLDDETRALLGFSQSQGGKRPDNVFTTFARHPALFKHFIVFGSYILTGSTLPPRDREIAILRIGWLCQSAYEWGQHAKIGRRCGLTEEEIRGIARGEKAGGWTEREAALIRAVDELHGDAFISDPTWNRLRGYYDTKQLIDLVFTVGQYNMVSMALNTFGVQLDERLSGFPEDEDGHVENGRTKQEEGEMNIWIASDHAGFSLKQDMIDYLRSRHAEWNVTDMGPEGDDSVDYPVFAHKVAAGVSRGDCQRGILICGTGLGMSMMANRFLGVRAALCTTVEMAELSRQHNNANILCLSGRKVSRQDNMAIIDKWLETGFTDEPRHVRRIELMDNLRSR